MYSGKPDTQEPEVKEFVSVDCQSFLLCLGRKGIGTVDGIQYRVNYLVCIFISRCRTQSKKKWLLVSAIVINLGMLVYYKYTMFLVENLNAILLAVNIEPFHIPSVYLPIGISFFTFQAISYVIDVFRGRARAQVNPINLGLYIALFPQLIAGPIIRYSTIEKQLINRSIDLDNFIIGIKRFIVGLGKKVLIANVLGEVADKIFLIPNGDLTTGLAWIGVLAYTFQILYDFSGYSDMAIGIGRMFGFTIPENFNYPYISDSIKEFWRRWHISLSSWFKDYVYIPLGGNRKSQGRNYYNLLVVFFLTGMWHGAEWNFIFWGIYHCAFVIIEKLGFHHVLSNLWKPIRHLYTFLVVMIGWILFRAENMPQAINFIKNFAGMHSGDGILYYPEMYLNNQVILSFIFAFVFCVPVIPYLTDKLLKKDWELDLQKPKLENVIAVAPVFESVIYCVITFFSLMWLANGTYNPFIYFRF